MKKHTTTATTTQNNILWMNQIKFLVAFSHGSATLF